jgi:hypothetical protein
MMDEPEVETEIESKPEMELLVSTPKMDRS